MKITRFRIENFKGIQTAEIEISTVAPGNVITLIGLNESGKTTILEALSHFVSVDADTTRIVNTVAPKQRPVDLIPKSRKSNFTGDISIHAFLELDDEDVSALCAYMAQEIGVRLVPEACQRSITVTRVYSFADSDPLDPKTMWNFSYTFFKRTGNKKHKEWGAGINRDDWLKATNFLATRFPKIVYFPTFLFSVPARIYLEDLPSWKPTDEEAILNRYFRQVIQDVADSLNDGVSIQRHIVDRISRRRDSFANPVNFFAALMGMDEYSQVRAVVSRLSGAITKTVFGAWNQIFDHGIVGKSVQIDWGVDSENGNIPYLQLEIFDGEHPYAIHERSLGFRWFFTFLLFTQFRKSRVSRQGTIFLFDEPASNLHARAQTKLLESFGRTADGNQYIVYSTHSHYMIDPMRLEKAYIVENEGIDFEGEEAGARFESRPTDIKTSRYRSFVSKYPTRVSYFQPALDALRFTFGPLVPGRFAVIVEGKFDFHPLAYFQDRLGMMKEVGIFPAPSASEAGTLISLMRGLGTRFVVVLDDDKPGRGAAKRYREDHLLSEAQVLTLGDLDSSLIGKAFEVCYSPEVAGLASEVGPPTKGQYSLLFQALRIHKDYKVNLGSTTDLVKGIMLKIEEALELPVRSTQLGQGGRSHRKRKDGESSSTGA
jgi:predicted ATPase